MKEVLKRMSLHFSNSRLCVCEFGVSTGDRLGPVAVTFIVNDDDATQTMSFAFGLLDTSIYYETGKWDVACHIS